MLNHQTSYKVYLALGPTDLRKSIDGLSLIVQERFKLDPFSRSLFVFCNRKQDKIKILEWDYTGFWLHYKRLEKDCFQWPDQTNDTHLEISDRAFRWLLDGLSIQERRAHKPVEERQII
jgi:transposase